MPVEIAVQSQRRGQGGECQVTVSDGKSQTTHIVTIQGSCRDKLADHEIPVERLVEKLFEFLLAREPKESILGSFPLPVISRYFPEFDQPICTML